MTPSAGYRRSVGLAVAVLAAAAPALAESRSYRIDPNHLSVAFLVEHVGYASVLGMFRDGEGTLVFDEESRRLEDVRVVVRTESVFTNQADRDRHLRSPDFLNVRQFPEMVFAAAGPITLDEEGRGRLDGELTLLGTTRPLALDVTWNKSAVTPLPAPDGGNPYVLGASARGSFRRSGLGMTYGVDNGWVGDEVQLIVELEAWRQ